MFQYQGYFCSITFINNMSPKIRHFCLTIANKILRSPVQIQGEINTKCNTNFFLANFEFLDFTFLSNDI